MTYNLGNNPGFLVQSVVSEDGHSIVLIDGERRAGDPTTLVADATKAKVELDWQPEYDELGTIIKHAWAWEMKLAKID